jgi:dTDP-4-dehydrorhamnose 3,5-epimerase
LQRLDTSLPEIWEFRPEVFRDERGAFLETYHAREFAKMGVFDAFVQDNQSVSVKNTLRGLHYQLRHPQAKLCRVIEGEALDIVVDIRVGSPNFARSASVLLSADLHNQVFIPSGFAHGFLALTDSVQFLYKCSNFYDRADERGIIWNDPSLGIEWGVSDPLISEKDASLPRLSEVPKDLLPVYVKR